MKLDNLKFNSLQVHAGELDDPYGSATVPIYQTSTFRFRNADHGRKLFMGEEEGYIYTRIGNPTIRALEKAIAVLEKGYDGIAFSSGMAAVNAVYLAFLGQGKHIICSSSVYGPSRTVLEKYYSRYGVKMSFVHTSDLDAIRKALQPNTALIYIETPANPTMELTDIKAVAQIAHENNALLAVDNTFATPYLQNPLELDADIVLHSITKFINGHADIVGGIVVSKNAELYKAIRQVMISFGGNMDPHQAYMTLRGVRTLSLRVEKAQDNAMKVAELLENHPKVAWVKYPGLKTHPQYELVKKQMRGYGTMISFELKGGLEAGKKLMDNVKLIILAVSLGGVESLIQHPASMTHAGMSKQARLSADITDGLVRLSVGIEDIDDLIADLEQALEKC